jgi:putative phosphonate catabolism associated alcohol dehydrogenase
MMVRAALFEGAGLPFRLLSRSLSPRLGEGELLVAVTLATVCGSDLHTWTGRRGAPAPCILGHEGVGRVVACGAGRERWLDRRITWSLADACGQCPPCARWGLPQKCEQLFKYGHAPLSAGSGLSGTYATHLVLRPGTHVVELPAAVSDAAAAPANCSLATMVHVTESLPSPCAVVVIQGAGMLGLHGCALLRAAGVPRVLVVDADAHRLARVTAYGGEAASIGDLPAGCADLVIEATGDASVVPDGMRVLRPGGFYHLVGLVHPDSALVLTGEAVIRGCATVRGFHNYAPPHLERAVAFLGHSSLDWGALVSPPLPLDGLDEAFALAQARQWARVAVAPDGGATAVPYPPRSGAPA